MLQHAEADTGDGSGDTDRTADVLVCHRPSGLVQPCVVLLGQTLICGNVNVFTSSRLKKDTSKMTRMSCKKAM